MWYYVMFVPDPAKHLKGIIHQHLFPNENVNKDVFILLAAVLSFLLSQF